MEIETIKKPSIQNLVTVDEYAILREKTKRTVYNWIAEGKLKTHEMFGKKLLNKFDLPKD